MTIIITKTKLALGILAMVLIGATTVMAADDNPFTDVPETGEGAPFYSEPVEWLWDNGLTTGTGDGTTFSPNDPVTRGQYATFHFRYDTNIVQPALSTINGRLDTAESDIDTAQADIDTAQADIDTAQADIDTAQADIDTAESDIDDLETNVATVASDVNNATRVHFARIEPDGTVEKTGNQAISATKTGTGIYDVVLPEDPENCAVTVALYYTYDGGFGGIGNLVYQNEALIWADRDTTNTDDEITVFIVDADDGDTTDGDTLPDFVDLDFVVTATCSDPVSFFDPGVIITPIIPSP